LEATWQTRCLGSLNQIRESGDERDSQWRVRQVYGDGKVLLDQLREVAELLAEGFNKSGSTSRDLLNGLVQKVRWSGGNFLCLVADDGEDGSALVGACDLTLLPAGGPKRSREGLVADVPTELNLPEDTHFLYLTGMVVPATYRRRGIGQALLHRCEAMAGKIEPAPACVALHVDKNNTGARKLYAGAGFTYVGWSEGDDSDPSRTSEDTGGLPWRLPFGKKKAKTEVLMVKWTPRGG